MKLKNMWKVSLVGHSQLPWDIEISGAEIRVFRAPGGRADSFYQDERLCEVLEWEHDLCILWLGSNDIEEDSHPAEIAERIENIVDDIETSCKAIVHVCLVEPRFYPGEEYMTHEQYGKIQRGINKKLRRRLNNMFIQFNSGDWIDEIAEDGVHFTEAGKQRVKKRLRKTIKRFMEDESDSG